MVWLFEFMVEAEDTANSLSDWPVEPGGLIRVLKHWYNEMLWNAVLLLYKFNERWRI